MKKLGYGLVLVLMLVLAACGHTEGKDSKKKESTETTAGHHQNEEMSEDHESMDHSSSGDIPKDLQATKDPKYPIGSKATIETDHMKGMKGAKATIVGAFNTTAYTVSYDPTNGGKRVENHKWVIQEEIKGGNKAMKPGDQVTLEADHMKGMKGAKAEIGSVKNTTVYMIDYVPTTGGEKVKNHKWVTEDELSPVK
ncbi:YdhK family protein [Aciduricibacillus chroicocephali]|uniref:YdhK family protein n=1 Tax=Aciduricibacillus chroicocephali TaxID=3054939 RepID=A0ABY9KUM7_9BACI|nr:YdhK family protein [Bacillaceae bacterium 44XB]